MEKMKGMLIGLYVGDLLGGPMEGKEPEILEEFSADKESEITHLALCVLRSLINCDGLDVHNLSNEFVSFFDSGPKSLGNTESSAFYSMKIGLDPHECGLLSGGNGSLLRCSPLALFYSQKALEKTSYLQTSLTHTGEICKVCDFLFLMALKLALAGMEKKIIFTTIIKKAQQLHLRVHDTLLKVPDLSWEDLETGSYILDAFAATFWGLLNTASFEQALIKIASKGDDSRACSALTGSLCGAYYGLNAIPDQWIKNTPLKAEIDAIISQVRIKNLDNFARDDNLK